MPLICAQEKQDKILAHIFVRMAAMAKTKHVGPIKDIVTFAEEDLRITLYPRQRLILKLFHGLDLTPEEKADWEYMLRAEDKYCRAWETGYPYNLIVLIAGRRGSKTATAAINQCYLLYKLLHSNPQITYKLLPKQWITFANVSSSESQAKIFFDMFKAMAEICNFLYVRTIRSLERWVEFTNKLVAESLHSNSRSIRGRTCFVVTFDELAHFIETGGPSSDEMVWSAMAPSVMTFYPEGAIQIATSPRAKEGTVWDKYQGIINGKIKNAICFQLATWELNNVTFKREDFDEEYENDFQFAEMEYGAQFGDTEDKFLPADKVHKIFTDDPFPSLEEAWETIVEKFKDKPKPIFYAHCDPGLKSNRLTFMVAHSQEDTQTVYIDYAFFIDPKISGEVDLEEAKQKIIAAYKIFRFRKVTFDQWNSALLIQQLKHSGIRAEELTLTAKMNAELYTNLHLRIAKEKVKCFKFPLLEAELTALVRKVKPNGFVIEAPTTGPVKTDDAADALSAVVYWCTLRLGEAKRTFLKV